MKLILRFLLASLFIFIGVKLLVPFHLYPIEHFEYKLLQIFPVSWKFVSIFSRILVGLLFSFSLLLIFYSSKQKWTIYIATIGLIIPFVVNSVYPNQLKDTEAFISEDLSSEIQIEKADTVLLAFLSYNCLHCKEGALKLKTAQQINPNFTKIIAISYNNKIDSFFLENDIQIPLQIISAKEFSIITEGSFPKYQLVTGNEIIKKWSPDKFNYAVMDALSK